jgi:MFS family permease
MVPQVSADRTSALSPLRYPAFRFLVGGRTVDLIGGSVAPIALAFAVLDLTGSVNDLGLVVGARSLFNVVFLLYGGVIADRLPRHLVLVGSGVLSGCSQATVAALVLCHSATIPLLLVLSAMNGTFAAFALPSSAALLPQTVPSELRPAANAVSRLAGNSAQIMGASFGGALVASVGAGWGLAVDAASFLLSALLFQRVRVRVPGTEAMDTATADGGVAARPGLISELRVGWREFVSRTWVWAIVLAFGFINAATAGSVQVLGPAVADATFGRSWWGGILAAQTAGMVVGGLVALRLRLRRLLMTGVACVGATVALPLGLALHLAPALLAVGAFAGGACVEQFGIAWEVSLQQEIPADRLARVYSYDGLGSFIAIPVAQITVGPLALLLGVRTALFAAAAIIALATVAMLTVRDVRILRTPAPQPRVPNEQATSASAIGETGAEATWGQPTGDLPVPRT